MSNKWKKMLNQFEDVVKYEYDSFAPENCLYTPSPSVNWIFANKSMGIPKGSGVMLYSSPKAGKSLLIQAAIAEMHKRDPEGHAIIFNSEMRGRWNNGTITGVDQSRLTIFDTNKPEEIFDRMQSEILPMILDGFPLRMLAIDSINSIGGTKAMAADRSVNDHLIGDHALTVQRGLLKILPIIRKHNLVAFIVTQVRANMDAGSYGPKEKSSASFALKHSLEYFVSLRKANAADDKMDIEGNKFEDEDMKDVRGNKEITGHKIIVKMEESSIGTPGRTAIITLDYEKGLVNQHEEVFLLGYNTGVIKREGTSKYVYKDISVVGKANFALKIKEDPQLYADILEDVRKLDA